MRLTNVLTDVTFRCVIVPVADKLVLVEFEWG